MRLRISFVLLFAVCSLSLAADTITVVSGSNAVFSAIAHSQPGDVILLSDGEYAESNKLIINHPLTLQAAQGANPVIRLKSRVELSADLTIRGLQWLADGAAEAIRMLPGEQKYDVQIDHCTFLHFSSKIIRAYASDQTEPYIHALDVIGCQFRPAAGARCIEASSANKQVANLSIRNSTFDGGEGAGRFIYFNSAEGTTVE